MGWLDSESTEDGRRDARKGADPSPPTFKFFGGRSDEEIAKNVGDYEKAYQTEHLRMMAENSQRTAEAQEAMRKMAEERNGASESGGSSCNCGSSSSTASSGVGEMVAVIVVVVFGFVALQHSCSGPSSSGYVQQSAPVPVYREPVQAYHEPAPVYREPSRGYQEPPESTLPNYQWHGFSDPAKAGRCVSPRHLREAGDCDPDHMRDYHICRRVLICTDY